MHGNLYRCLDVVEKPGPISSAMPSEVDGRVSSVSWLASRTDKTRPARQKHTVGNPRTAEEPESSQCGISHTPDNGCPLLVDPPFLRNKRLITPAEMQGCDATRTRLVGASWWLTRGLGSKGRVSPLVKQAEGQKCRAAADLLPDRKGCKPVCRACRACRALDQDEPAPAVHSRRSPSSTPRPAECGGPFRLVLAGSQLAGSSTDFAAAARRVGDFDALVEINVDGGGRRPRQREAPWGPPRVLTNRFCGKISSTLSISKSSLATPPRPALTLVPRAAAGMDLELDSRT